jgi:hypothetical protein
MVGSPHALHPRRTMGLLLREYVRKIMPCGERCSWHLLEGPDRRRANLPPGGEAVPVHPLCRHPRASSLRKLSALFILNRSLKPFYMGTAFLGAKTGVGAVGWGRPEMGFRIMGTPGRGTVRWELEREAPTERRERKRDTAGACRPHKRLRTAMLAAPAHILSQTGLSASASTHAHVMLV